MARSFKKLLIPFLLAVIACATNARAEQKRIVLWNARELFSVDAVNNARATDLQNFGSHFSDADIVILDEITSLTVVNAARDKMGFTGFHTACSDFAQADYNQFGSLEVGIISRFPLTNVLEFDQTTDNTGQPGEPACGNTPNQSPFQYVLPW